MLNTKPLSTPLHRVKENPGNDSPPIPDPFHTDTNSIPDNLIARHDELRVIEGIQFSDIVLCPPPAPHPSSQARRKNQTTDQQPHIEARKNPPLHPRGASSIING